jgi:hypothetical protein
MAGTRAIGRRVKQRERARGGSTETKNRGKDPDPSWRIIPYVDGDSGERLYAVTHRGRRRAWGLKDRAAAERWLLRNNVPVQQQLSLVE